MKTILTVVLTLFVSCAYAQYTEDELASRVVNILKSGEYTKMAELLPSDELLVGHVKAQGAATGVQTDQMKGQLRALSAGLGKSAETLATTLGDLCGMETINVQETKLMMREGQTSGLMLIKISCKNSWRQIPIAVSKTEEGLAFLGIAGK